MITDFHQPAMLFKVQWFEWHPMGWRLEWLPFPTREEAEAEEKRIEDQEKHPRSHVRAVKPGMNIDEMIAHLNANDL